MHVATFLLVVMLLPGAHPLWVAVVNLLLLQAWSTTLYFSYNGPSWTISTEAAFYVAFPLLVQRWSRTWPWKLALAFALMTAIVAYCNHLNHARTFLLVHLNPLARLFEFVLGMTATLGVAAARRGLATAVDRERAPGRRGRRRGRRGW